MNNNKKKKKKERETANLNDPDMNKKAKTTSAFLGALPHDTLAHIGTFLTMQELRHLCPVSQESNRQWAELIIHLCLAPTDLIAASSKNKFDALFTNVESLIIQLSDDEWQLLPRIFQLIQPTIQSLTFCCETSPPSDPVYLSQLSTYISGCPLLTHLLIVGDHVVDRDCSSLMFYQLWEETQWPPLFKTLTSHAINLFENRRIVCVSNSVEEEEEQQTTGKLGPVDEQAYLFCQITRLPSPWHFKCQMLRRLSLRWELAEARAHCKQHQLTVDMWNYQFKEHDPNHPLSMWIAARIHNELHAAKIVLDHHNLKLTLALNAFDALNY